MNKLAELHKKKAEARLARLKSAEAQAKIDSLVELAKLRSKLCDKKK